MKSMLKVTIAAALLAASAAASAANRPATPAEIELVREGLQERLKDADSAKFRDVQFGGKDGDTVCGQVNSKNSFGGYAGYTAFLGIYIGPEDYTDAKTVKHKASVYIISVDESDSSIAAGMCKDRGF